MDILSEICADKLEHIEKQKQITSHQELLDNISDVVRPRGFFKTLENKFSKGENAIITEIKKASPSKGIIRENFNPSEIAKSYADGGAACLSILTDKKYFQGSDEYIQKAKNICELPILRKDFILDTYQVAESRALGADCILLIMAAVNDDLASNIIEEANSLELDVLVEVHNEEELTRALKLDNKLIGINNRNLKTLEIDLNNTSKLLKNIPENYLIICESGIESNKDILKMNELGIFCFLVGTSLMKQENIKDGLEKLLGK